MQQKKRPGVSKQRLRVILKHDWHCQRCRCEVYLPKGPQQGTVDHIIPKALGGTGRAENLQLLCWTCNQKKASFLEDGVELPPSSKHSTKRVLSTSDNKARLGNTLSVADIARQHDFK